MKVTPKISELMRSEHIGEVNRMLDAGKSPGNVHKYLVAAGYQISAPTVYKYARMRQEKLLDSAQGETESEAGTEEAWEIDEAAKGRLLTEVQALDALIEKGAQAVREMDPKEVTPKLMMDAIRLKQELTGGDHAQLTVYGYKSLKSLEDQRWHRVLEFMMQFIRDDQMEEVRIGVEQIEASIFEGTPWQDEYLQAKAKAGLQTETDLPHEGEE